MQTSTASSIHDTLPYLLVYLNRLLSSYQDFPHNITKALEKLGEVSRHDRIHILEIHQNMTFSIIYEWNNQQAGPTPKQWRSAPVIQHNPLENQLCTRNYIIIREENEADAVIHHLLEEQNCHQMLLLPLFESGSHFAFLSFLQCTQTHDWSEEEIQILSQVASIVATRLNNYRLIHRMLYHLNKYHQQKTDFLLQYHRIKQIQSDLFSTWENVKKSNPHLNELSKIEHQITQMKEIYQSLIEK